MLVEEQYILHIAFRIIGTFLIEEFLIKAPVIINLWRHYLTFAAENARLPINSSRLPSPLSTPASDAFLRIIQ